MKCVSTYPDTHSIIIKRAQVGNVAQKQMLNQTRKNCAEVNGNVNGNKVGPF